VEFGGVSALKERASWQGLKLLGHEDAVAFHAVREGALRSEGAGSGFNVADAAIDGLQFGTKAEDDNVHGLAAAGAQMVLGGLDKSAPEPCALMGGIDCELAHVPMFSSDFYIDTTKEESGAVFDHQNRAWQGFLKDERDWWPFYLESLELSSLASRIKGGDIRCRSR
jgi:hypothetical protein